MNKLMHALLALFLLVSATSAVADQNIKACFDFVKAGDYPRAIESGKKAINTAPKDDDSHYCLGDAYRRSGELNMALREMQRAEGLSNDKAALMYIYNQLGLILSNMGENEQALQQYNRYLALSRELGKTSEEGSALNNIAIIYQSRNQYDLALEYFDKSLKLKEHEDQKGTTYSNLALVYLAKGEYGQSIEYSNKAIAIQEHIGDYHGQAQSLLNLGNTYCQIKSYSNAGDNLFKGLEKIRKVQDVYWEAVAHFYIGNLYRDMGNIPLARKWLKAGLDIFTRIGAKDNAQATQVLLEALMQPRPYAGIEIGAKGVKTIVLVMTPQQDDTYNVNEPFRRSINTTIFAGVKEKGVFEPQAIEETAKAVKELYEQVTSNYKVGNANFYLVASSAVAKATNRDQLAGKVKELTGLTLEFITKDDEVLYNLVGSVPVDRIVKALSVDIGSGNTKIGYLDKSSGNNSVVAFDIPLGTVSLTDVVIKAGDDPKALSNAADKTLKAELSPKIRQEIQKHPGYRNRRPVYLAGGIVWAVATMTKPGNVQDFCKITPADVDTFIAGVKRDPEAYLNPSLTKVKDADTRKWAEGQIRSVKDVFTPENLLSGAKLLKATFTEMKIKEGYFARWGSWLAGRVYLQAYAAEEQSARHQ